MMREAHPTGGIVPVSQLLLSCTVWKRAIRLRVERGGRTNLTDSGDDPHHRLRVDITRLERIWWGSNINIA